MPPISVEVLKQKNRHLSSLENEFSQWRPILRECADNFLPQRYRWLMSSKEYTSQRARRHYILNSTGIQSARVLSAGMMNGITSPSRPWFKLRVPGVEVERYRDLAIWLEEVERILLRIMSESNFYNSMAVLYLDMSIFGTGASLVYEDKESVIRCYNPPLGEYYLAQSARMSINTFARKFYIKLDQFIERWPDRRDWSDHVKNMVDSPSVDWTKEIEIGHLIEPNTKNLVASRFPYVEMYWEARRNSDHGRVLEKRGFNELPGIFGRWEVNANDAYGVSPAMESLGDNIELQILHRDTATLREMMHRPPTLIDSILMNNPLGLMPGGKTFVPNLNNTAGAKPIFTVNPQFDQLNMEKISTEQRIRNAFYNYLFTGVTELETVRSATEIAARESEKLILLGGVLERFESEALDPGITRIYSIADRMGLIPAPPPGFDNIELEVQYVSILSVAQRAAGTAPTERALALVGNLAAVYPQALDIPDFDRMLRNYFLDIGVRQSELRSEEAVAGGREAREAAAASESALAAGDSLSSSAKNLSATDVGGGQNALSAMLGGGV